MMRAKVLLAAAVLTLLAPMAQAGDPEGSIVYSRTRLPHGACCYSDIYSIAPDGSGERAIVEDGFYAENAPAISPDGSMVAYATNRGGIHVADLEGTVVYRVNVDSAYWPSWSPDGRKLAFHMYTEEHGYSIAISKLTISRLDDSRVRLVTSGPLDVAPQWSPDGRWIVFSRYGARDGVSASQIYLTRPDGSHLRLLTTGHISAFKGVWSPNGQTIAFEGVDYQEGMAETFTDDIYLLTVKTGKLTQLTSGSNYDIGPCWSPDGTKLAFSRSPVDAGVYIPAAGRGAYYGAPADLFIVEADGSGLEQLTVTPHVSETYCDWG